MGVLFCGYDDADLDAETGDFRRELEAFETKHKSQKATAACTKSFGCATELCPFAPG